MEVKNIRQIFKKYLLGSANENESRSVDNWYQSFENKMPVRLTEEEAKATKQEIWERIAPAIRIEKKVRTMPPYLKVAAMLVVVIGAGLVFLLINRKNFSNNVLAYTSISTKNGEKKTITIADGSVLTLNAGTSIRIQNDFSKERKINLIDGEVYFDVKKDAGKPFLIESGNLTTTVLGTSFNISAYKEINKINIGVTSGKISIASNASTLGILEKNQELVYNKSAKTYTTQPLDENMLAWKEGRLVLNDASFEEMSFLIKKIFGISIVTEDAFVKSTKYTTELFTTMTPTQVTEVLAAIHGLKIKQKGNQINLSK